jgi:hypothetical protein
LQYGFIDVLKTSLKLFEVLILSQLVNVSVSVKPCVVWGIWAFGMDLRYGFTSMLRTSGRNVLRNSVNYLALGAVVIVHRDALVNYRLKNRGVTMAVINRPLSLGKGWQDVSIYKDYADLARMNLSDSHYFETIVICCIGIDVLLNTLPDRLLVFSSKKLTDCQKEVLRSIESNHLTAGAIIGKLEMACILHGRLLRALRELNEKRNKVFHPFQKGKRKFKGVFPSQATKADAEGFYRKFCHVIDLAGGRSPRSDERELNRYVEERKRNREKHFIKP